LAFGFPRARKVPSPNRMAQAPVFSEVPPFRWRCSKEGMPSAPPAREKLPKGRRSGGGAFRFGRKRGKNRKSPHIVGPRIHFIKKKNILGPESLISTEKKKTRDDFGSGPKERGTTKEPIMHDRLEKKRKCARLFRGKKEKATERESGLNKLAQDRRKKKKKKSKGKKTPLRKRKEGKDQQKSHADFGRGGKRTKARSLNPRKRKKRKKLS